MWSLANSSSYGTWHLKKYVVGAHGKLHQTRSQRSLLVHGARSVVIRAANKDDRLSRWINKVSAERGFNKAVVALANKMARFGWAVVALPLDEYYYQ